MIFAALLIGSCARSDGGAFPLAALQLPAKATGENTDEGRTDYTIGKGAASMINGGLAEILVTATGRAATR